MWRYALMLGAYQRFKEQGDFTYWIRIPKCKGLKIEYDSLVFVSIR